MPREPFRASRFDPFSEDLVSVAYDGAWYHVPEDAPYQILLKEVATPEALCRVSVLGYVETLSAPSAGEFRVDHTYGSGLIEFNIADRNKDVQVTYRGIGAALQAEQFNSFYRRFPETVWSAGHAVGDWRGTHFTSGASPVPGMWECGTLTPYARERQLVRYDQYHFWSSGYSTSLASFTMSAARGIRPWIANPDSKFRGDMGGTGALLVRFRAPVANNHGAFFAYWGRRHSTVIYTIGWSPANTTIWHEPFPRPIDSSPVFVSTWVSTFTGTGTIPVLGSVMVAYPGWSTLPCGFGVTSAGTYYFCTYSRQDAWPTSLNTFSMLSGISTLVSFMNYPNVASQTSVLGWMARIGGPEGIKIDITDVTTTDIDGTVTTLGTFAGAKYPPSPSNTLGGFVTLIPSSVFCNGAGAWYSVSIELSPSVARCYVNNILVAVHTTHVPFFDHPYHFFEFDGIVSTCHPASWAGPSIYDVDSYAVGRISPLTPVDTLTDLDAPGLREPGAIPIWKWWINPNNQ